MLATAVMTALCSGSLAARSGKRSDRGGRGLSPFSWTEPSGEVKGFWHRHRQRPVRKR